MGTASLGGKLHRDATGKFGLLLAGGESMIVVVFSFSLATASTSFYYLYVILGNTVTICNTRSRTSLGDEEALI